VGGDSRLRARFRIEPGEIEGGSSGAMGAYAGRRLIARGRCGGRDSLLAMRLAAGVMRR